MTLLLLSHSLPAKRADRDSSWKISLMLIYSSLATRRATPAICRASAVEVAVL